MNLTVNLDWKAFAALGATAVAIIFAVKMDALAAERVSTCMVDAYRDFAITTNSNYQNLDFIGT